MKTQEKFNPSRGFDSPREALDYCNGFPEPPECFIQVLRYNLEVDEVGFARELLDLWWELKSMEGPFRLICCGPEENQ